jgi:GTPase SAR1 family protein
MFSIDLISGKTILSQGKAIVRQSLIDTYGIEKIRRLFSYGDEIEIIVVKDEDYDEVMNQHTMINYS